MMKGLYNSDKAHLHKYGRPVTGDIYVKMSYGPVPSLVCDTLRGNENLPPDVLDAVHNALEIERCGKLQQVSARRRLELFIFWRVLILNVCEARLHPALPWDLEA
ncbi:MAG: DUF4065 domain-containing protein [Proteobacteria bacterium]|nr:DUF4065 domain-containing protein [Pseudomonadota bacterium]